MKNLEKKAIRFNAFKHLSETMLGVIAVIALVYFLRNQPWLPKEIGEHLWFKFMAVTLFITFMSWREIRRLITGKEEKSTRF